MAYSAARMAVEITKESSDMFLPVKAVVGAISVLVKNYDVSGLFYDNNTSLSHGYSHSSKPRTMRRW